jgi:hypothetical protein
MVAFEIPATLNKLLEKVENDCPKFTLISGGVGKNLQKFHKVVNFKPNAKFLLNKVKMKYTTIPYDRKGYPT